MMAQKGMDLLIEAVPMVLGYFPHAKFVLAVRVRRRSG